MALFLIVVAAIVVGYFALVLIIANGRELGIGLSAVALVGVAVLLLANGPPLWTLPIIVGLVLGVPAAVGFGIAKAVVGVRSRMGRDRQIRAL